MSCKHSRTQLSLNRSIIENPYGHHFQIYAYSCVSNLVTLLNTRSIIDELCSGSDESEIHFLIKIYQDGAFTPLIEALKIG